MRKSLKLSWHAFMDYFIVQSPVRACFDIFPVVHSAYISYSPKFSYGKRSRIVGCIG